MQTKKKGFTLIELLVVVLIIGILAGVALAQYNKAVFKSRAMEDILILKTIYRVQQAHFLEHGVYATTFDELSIDIPCAAVKNKPGALKCNVSTITLAKDYVSNDTDKGYDINFRYDPNSKNHSCYAKNDLGRQICLYLGGVPTGSVNALLGERYSIPSV